MEWLAAEKIPVAVALTKSDKLSGARASEAAGALARDLGLDPARVAAVSARTGSGIEQLAAWIHDWSGTELRRPS